MVFRAAGEGQVLPSPSPPHFPGPTTQPITAPFGPVDLLPLLFPPPEATAPLCSVMPGAQLERREPGTQGRRAHSGCFLSLPPGGPFCSPETQARAFPQGLRPWQEKVPHCPLVLCVHLSDSLNFSVLAAPTSWPINIFSVISKTNLKKRKKKNKQ